MYTAQEAQVHVVRMACMNHHQFEIKELIYFVVGCSLDEASAVALSINENN